MTSYEERVGVGRQDWAHASADHLARYLFASGLVRAGSRWLDAGTGEGYGAAILRAASAAVVGCDLNRNVVLDAARRFGGVGLAFVVQDVERLGFRDRSIDVVCSLENIEHLRRPERFVREAARVLREDGLLVCSTPDRAGTAPFREGRPANPFHLQEWYRDEFAALLREGFGRVELLVQVKTHEFAARELAADSVARSLAELWANPFVRLGRWLSEARGHVFHVPSGRELGIARPSDYPIVPMETAALFGSSLCHIALCREPRRARA
jgi:SAM-dependent methyltransferase